MQETPGSMAFPWHFHESCEVLYVLRGNISYNIDGFVFALRPYDALIIPPSTYHFPISENEEIYENYVINFPQELLPSERLSQLFSPPSRRNLQKNAALFGFWERFDLCEEALPKEGFAEAAAYLIGELCLLAAGQPVSADT